QHGNQTIGQLHAQVDELTALLAEQQQPAGGSRACPGGSALRTVVRSSNCKQEKDRQVGQQESARSS
ncbi:MAG: hypothetical protein JXR40_01205, partial [Pontiellaceae bacterium]|nr:hypothetical protein [Pontiellaceae bacterium]